MLQEKEKGTDEEDAQWWMQVFRIQICWAEDTEDGRGKRLRMRMRVDAVCMGPGMLTSPQVDENGRAIAGENQVYALCGFVRAQGEADDAFNRLAQRDGFLKNVWNPVR